MPTVNVSPLGPKPQFMLSTGLPASGYKLFWYVAGSTSTKQNTYTDSTGTVANTNPLVMNTLGEPATQIWLTAGQAYKAVLAPSTDTDPPTSPIWTIDNLRGINDTSVTIDQWVSGPAPTYINASQFSLVGDQTSDFQVGRRIKATVTAGTVYGTITVSTFAAVTTVTMAMDSTSLDSGLSAVSYGLLTPTDPSTPLLPDDYPIVSGSADRTKKVRFEVDGLTTATTRVITVPDSNLTLIYSATDGVTMNAGVLTAPLRGYLSGLTMSTAGSSATMSIAAGQCTDSTNVAAMALAAIAKTTSAWAVGTGNGGLDTGAIANTTWYHFYVIRRPDTGVVDVTFSTNASTPTLPANYTQYRRIGSGLTNGSAQWIAFTQDGDLFQWSVPALETTSANPGTAAVTQTLANVPTGVNVRAVLNAMTNANYLGYVSDLATTDAAPSATAAPGTNIGSSSANPQTGQLTVRTNTSAQIRTRISSSGGGERLYLVAIGWFDTRGK